MGKYLEVKWHGRAGQGLLTAAAVLAEVLVMEGKYVQAFPGFNLGERAPFSSAYNRLSESPLRLHSTIENADAAVIMDPALILNTESNSHCEAKKNAKENAFYIVNTPLSPEYIKEKLEVPDSIVVTLDADTIAREELGRTIPNIPIMALLIRWLNWIPLEKFKQRLNESLIHTHRLEPELVQANIRTIDRGLTEVKEITINNQ